MSVLHVKLDELSHINSVGTDFNTFLSSRREGGTFDERQNDLARARLEDHEKVPVFPYLRLQVSLFA